MHEEILGRYRMQKHPEGGYYVETYRSSLEISVPYSSEPRSASTAIMFMLTSNSPVSTLHRIQADEIWNYYSGTDDLVVIELSGIDNDGADVEYISTRLGNASGIYQHVVKANTWFGSILASEYDLLFENAKERKQEGNFAFVGCVCSPGFDFKDFELANQKALPKLYKSADPLLRKMISQ